MEVKYYTKEGLERLKNEVHRLKTKERAKIAQQIAEARDKGDLSENAEYDAAKEAQGMLEMKINQLETELGKARILDASRLDKSKINILSKVTVINKKFNKKVTYQIVSDSEADVRKGKISVNTPIAKGLLGKKVGDVVDIEVPRGVMRFEVVDIDF